MRKVLIICGPTATGKTSLSLKLAKKFSGELISADSRQVYTGLDVGTGKDVPKNFKLKQSPLVFNHKKVPVYSNFTKIWGYDLVLPTEEFSTSHFVNFSNQVIKYLWSKSTLPIVVGGTGLYLKSLITPPSSLNIPPDNKLRAKLNKLNLKQLIYKLEHLDLNRFNQLNQSDRHNPRRLIRAIEIAKSKKTKPTGQAFLKSTDCLWIGLNAPTSFIDKQIRQRVILRINQGMTQEVNQLTKVFAIKNLPATTSIGYKQWSGYLQGKYSQKTAIDLWCQAEQQYARRQKTWFKKQPNIHWLDITNPNYYKNIVATVKNWYSKPR